MDSVPQAPDQQTRNAVTARIIAHVAALLPGHREPTPILRLRWQGSAGNWAIGIYKASTGQYTESELPGSFGPATGTPEQGIDDTFILYAGPRTGN
jgi:hypothetical protein